MKQRILVIVSILIALSASAYTLIKWSPPEPTQEMACLPVAATPHAQPMESFGILPEFVFSVDNRFMTTITRNALQSARSITDLVPKEVTSGLSDFRDVKVLTFSNNIHTAIGSQNEVLNDNQLKLLHSMDYSSDFCLESYCKNQASESGALEDYHLVYCLTVVPEKQAEYSGGYKAITDYLRKNSDKEISTIKWAKLRPGQISFKVTKKWKSRKHNTSIIMWYFKL